MFIIESHTPHPDQLLTFYFQPLSTLFPSLLPQRSTPLTNKYIQQSCFLPAPDPHTLLHALQTASPPISETEIAAEILDHLTAGIDTTGAALTFLLYTLSLPCNTEIQEKLYRSLHREPQSPNREPETNGETNEETDKYLHSIIQESLRLHPPIPMSQPRLTRNPRIIDGYIIPGNATVSVQAWSLHRNARIFGDDAEIFRPERWLGNRDEAREMEKGFLAFGRGGRACTGKEYVTSLIDLFSCPLFPFSHAGDTVDSERENTP
ncbi:hypothetical protein NHQ30_004910 [Ciborinia camelliae]|nr:hypothetical protein NHQ30_004910 [Ciborinia camelliae]